MGLLSKIQGANSFYYISLWLLLQKKAEHVFGLFLNPIYYLEYHEIPKLIEINIGVSPTGGRTKNENFVLGMGANLFMVAVKFENSKSTPNPPRLKLALVSLL